MSPQLLNRNVTPRSPAPRSRRVGDVKRVASRGAWVTEHGLTTRGPGEGGAPCGGYRESGPPRDRAAARRGGPGGRLTGEQGALVEDEEVPIEELADVDATAGIGAPTRARRDLHPARAGPERGGGG